MTTFKQLRTGSTPWLILAFLILAATAVLSASTVAASTSPGQPAGVTVTRSGDTLTATWDAPAGATKYHVTYSSDGKKSWSAAAGPDDGHTATTIDITGIDTSKAYVVGVRAGNEHGWGGWRNSAPNNPAGPPARVEYVSLNRVDGSLTASWNSVVGADKYHITYSSDGGQSWSLASGNHTGTSIAISVDNQHTYKVGVRAGKTSGGDTLWGNWRNSWSSPPYIPADPPPSAPASVSLNRTCNAMGVSWTPVAGATGYDMNISKNNRKSWQRALSNVTYTTWEFAKWSKNKPYTIAVRARNGGGESGWTNSATVPPPPCEVGNLRAVTSTTHGTAGGSITTSWDAATRANAYNVNYRAYGGQWQRIASNVSATIHTGTVSSTGGYTVAVQSVNGGYTSQWRNAGVPWLTAGSITGGEATLTLAGHSGDWYVKKTSPSPAGTCSSAISGGTHTLGSLSSNTTYSYGAYRDASCATELAGTTFATTGPTAPATPAAPGLTTGNAQLAAAWTAPSNGGSAINDYDLRYRQVGTTTWTRVSDGGSVGTTPVGGSDTASSTDPIDFGNFGAGITRESLGSHQGLYKVPNAIDEMHIYLQANSGSNFTMRTSSSKPTALNTGTVLASSATATPNNRFTEWVGPIAANGYFWASPDSGSSTYATRFRRIYHIDLFSTATTYTITGLTNGTAYEVSVRAGNSIGDGQWSTPTTYTPGVPARPAAPTLVAGDQELTVSWTAPLDNGSTVTDYDLRYSSDSGATWTEVTDTTSTDTTATITGLANGTGYVVQVRAGNTHGDGLWSPSSASEIPQPAPAAPSAPTLTAGARQLTVTWTAPTGHGLIIEDYDVQYRKSGATDWTDWAHTGTAVTATITGLEGAVTYEVQVRAESSVGEGAWSATASLATNAGKPDTPATPTLVWGANQATVQWTAPYNGGSALTGFKVQYKTSSASDWTTHTFSSTGSTTSTIIGSLTSGTSYDFQVRATNAQGDSPWSTTATGTLGAPARVTATVARGNGQLTVSWTAPADNGNAIYDYDVRYRQAGTSAWTRISDGGSVGQTHVTGNDSASSTDPIDFGNLGAGITREALGSNQGLYKVPNAIDAMRIYMQANNGAAFTLRTSASKPTDLSVGTVLASSATSTPNNQFTEWVGPIAANGYFWAAPTSGSSTYNLRYRRIYHIDLATTTTSYTVTGLTNDTAYEVQVRAENSQGSGQWSAAVSATPTAPTLTVTEVKAKEAKLNITIHKAQWYYKADKAPHTDCQGPVAANTAQKHVTGLSPGTAYVYTAYSDSGCSTTLATASSFTTPISLDVYNVTVNSARFLLNGWSGNWWLKRTGDTFCQIVYSGGYGTIGGLNHSSQYTAKAYSKDGCNAADEVASLVFNTPIPGGGPPDR